MTNLRLEGLGAVAASTTGAIGAILDWPIALVAATALAFIVTFAHISSIKRKNKSGGSGIVKPVEQTSEHTKVAAY